MTSSTLDQRYGKRRPTGGNAPRISGRTWTVIAVVAILACASIVAWFVLSRSDNPTFKEVSFSAGRPDRTTLDFELTKNDDDVVTCALQALNVEHAIVGWDEITVGELPAERLNNKTSAHHVEIRTTSPAHTATVDSCWIQR